MSHYINDIAIMLTQKLEREIVYTFHNKQEIPSCRNIRECLLEVLKEYINVATITEKSCPREFDGMPEGMKKQLLEHKREQRARRLADMVLEDKDVSHKYIYNKDTDYYRSETTYMPVIKLEKLRRETDDSYLKGRFK